MNNKYIECRKNLNHHHASGVISTYRALESEERPNLDLLKESQRNEFIDYYQDFSTKYSKVKFFGESYDRCMIAPLKEISGIEEVSSNIKNCLAKLISENANEDGVIIDIIHNDQQFGIFYHSKDEDYIKKSYDENIDWMSTTTFMRNSDELMKTNTLEEVRKCIKDLFYGVNQSTNNIELPSNVFIPTLIKLEDAENFYQMNVVINNERTL